MFTDNLVTTYYKKNLILVANFVSLDCGNSGAHTSDVFNIEWDRYHCWFYSLLPTSERLSYRAPEHGIFVTYKACTRQEFSAHFSTAVQLTFIS
jgi:hypothetical protein